jgi:hypothetical protein
MILPRFGGGTNEALRCGADRGQSTLLPECLDDFIGESNPVRVIDLFVDSLDLAELDFDGVDPAATGRPAYHPSVLLSTVSYFTDNCTGRSAGFSLLRMRSM